jgi:hypothetical protein
MENSLQIPTAEMWLDPVANMLISSRDGRLSTKMAGRYKEEPGVAVTGDHVSTRLFSSTVTILSDFDYRACVHDSI